MADFVFNISAGKVAEYAARVNADDPVNSVFLVVPVLSVGLETDAVLKDMDTLAAVFAGATDEATAGGWNRKTLDQTGGITVIVTDASDKAEVDCPDQTWTTVAAGNNAGKLLVCYDSDSTGGTDANVVPMVALDFVVTTDGNDVVWQPNASGFSRATT